VWLCGLDSSGSGCGLVAGSCKRVEWNLWYYKRRGIFWPDEWLLDSPPWRKLVGSILVGIILLNILLESTENPEIWLFVVARFVWECIQKFPNWVDNETTIINSRWEATQRVMAAKLTRLTHKIATQLHLVAQRSIPFAVLAPGGHSGNFWLRPRACEM
jgi:hypothetical protein